MEGIIAPSFLNHRSKARIKQLGEVFTPEVYVEGMLSVFADENNSLWSDESVSFFEPCCGHGNIVIPIFMKRLEALFSKSLTQNPIEYAAYYAVANAINSIWAIDIDPENVFDCRTRVFEESIKFLINKINPTDINCLINNDKDYIAHLICAIMWHIHENEMLSAMAYGKKLSEFSANKIKISREWISENKHKPLNFDLTWTFYFKEKEQKHIVPLLFRQALKFIGAVSANQGASNNTFSFANILFVKNICELKSLKSRKIWSQV